MTWRRHILVVASVTATSEELMSLLSKRASEAPTDFTLVCPAARRADGGAAAARANLDGASQRMRELGLPLVAGRVALADPFEAVVGVYDPRRHDEIIVSTLPTETSRWVALDAPRRIARHTGASVTHVAGRTSKTFA